MMNINDLLNQWKDSIEKALPKIDEDIPDEHLCVVEGMRIRSSVLVGGPYMPKMTLYQGCSQYCK